MSVRKIWNLYGYEPSHYHQKSIGPSEAQRKEEIAECASGSRIKTIRKFTSEKKTGRSFPLRMKKRQKEVELQEGRKNTPVVQRYSYSQSRRNL